MRALPVTDCECAPPVADTPVTPPAENTDASGSDSPQSCVVAATDAVGDVDKDPLWEYVVACAVRDAAKAVDIRNALEARFGKETSKSLLANTKASVAQDASGRAQQLLSRAAPIGFYLVGPCRARSGNLGGVRQHHLVGQTSRRGTATAA